MNRYLIHVSTNWCRMDNTLRAIAESEGELYDLAEELAYDNFESYNLWEEIAREEGYDPDEMSEADWDWLYANIDESNYYSYDIEEFSGDDKEWEEYGGLIYGLEQTS